VRILPYDNDGFGSLDYVGDRDGFEQYQDASTGECFQLENGEYVLTDCLATRPRVVPTQTGLTTNNPFGVAAYSGGNLATVNTKIPAASSNMTLLLVAGGLLALLVLKQ
jgi:hypothetical protein